MSKIANHIYAKVLNASNSLAKGIRAGLHNIYVWTAYRLYDANGLGLTDANGEVLYVPKRVPKNRAYNYLYDADGNAFVDADGNYVLVKP